MTRDLNRAIQYGIADNVYKYRPIVNGLFSGLKPANSGSLPRNISVLVMNHMRGAISVEGSETEEPINMTPKII